MKSKFIKIMWRVSFLSVLLIGLLFMIPSAQAAVGDTLATITVAVPSPSGVGVSVAADCNGDLYYTNYGDSNLHKIDSAGNLLDTIPITDSVTGDPLTLDALAWDNGRGLLWAGDGHNNGAYQLDPATGVATFQFSGDCNNCYGLIDGIAYDGEDDTIWWSSDVENSIWHYQVDGTLIGILTPLDAGGSNLYISGLAVGGAVLYVGTNGQGTIYKIDKASGVVLDTFATPGGRDEDLECDNVNFAPLEAMWSKDAYNDTIVALEVAPGTCICGGGGACNPIGLKDGAIELKQDALAALDAGDVEGAKDLLAQAIANEKLAIEQLETCFECENEHAVSGAIALINRAIGLEEHAIHALEQSRPMIRKAKYNIGKSIDALYKADMLLEACDQPRRPEKQRPAVRRP